MIISNLNTCDLARIVEIESSVQVDPWEKEAFARCVDGLFVSWGLWVELTLVGFLIVDTRCPEWHILNLAIDARHQHQGHARFLLKQLLEWSVEHKPDCIHLEVRASNTHAIALYESLGFVAVGRRKNYYPAMHGVPVDDAILYSIHLSQKAS